MSQSQPSIREELQEAFKEEFRNSLYFIHKPHIEWTAKWMAERCAKEAEKISKGLDNEWNRKIGKADDLSETAQDCADSIRQLATELDQ